MKTTVILFRNLDQWALARYAGDTVPASAHPTAAAARRYAKARGWRVRRATNCDQA